MQTIKRSLKLIVLLGLLLVFALYVNCILSNSWRGNNELRAGIISGNSKSFEIHHGLWYICVHPDGQCVGLKAAELKEEKEGYEIEKRINITRYLILTSVFLTVGSVVTIFVFVFFNDETARGVATIIIIECFALITGCIAMANFKEFFTITGEIWKEYESGYILGWTASSLLGVPITFSTILLIIMVTHKDRVVPPRIYTFEEDYEAVKYDEYIKNKPISGSW